MRLITVFIIILLLPTVLATEGEECSEVLTDEALETAITDAGVEGEATEGVQGVDGLTLTDADITTPGGASIEGSSVTVAPDGTFQASAQSLISACEVNCADALVIGGEFDRALITENPEGGFDIMASQGVMIGGEDGVFATAATLDGERAIITDNNQVGISGAPAKATNLVLLPRGEAPQGAMAIEGVDELKVSSSTEGGGYIIHGAEGGYISSQVGGVSRYEGADLTVPIEGEMVRLEDRDWEIIALDPLTTEVVGGGGPEAYIIREIEGLEGAPLDYSLEGYGTVEIMTDYDDDITRLAEAMGRTREEVARAFVGKPQEHLATTFDVIDRYNECVDPCVRGGVFEVGFNGEGQMVLGKSRVKNDQTQVSGETQDGISGQGRPPDENTAEIANPQPPLLDNPEPAPEEVANLPPQYYQYFDRIFGSGQSTIPIAFDFWGGRGLFEGSQGLVGNFERFVGFPGSDQQFLVEQGEGVQIVQNNILFASNAQSLIAGGTQFYNLQDIIFRGSQAFAGRIGELNSGCTNIQDIEESLLTITDEHIELDSQTESTIKITDCGYNEVKYNPERGVLSLTKESPPTYELTNGSIVLEQENFFEKVDVDDTAIIEFDVQNGIACITIEESGTYWYNDKTYLEKDFAVHIPKGTEPFKLCIRKDESQQFNEYDGLIDFPSNAKTFLKAVQYSRYPIINERPATLIMEPVFTNNENFDIVMELHDMQEIQRLQIKQDSGSQEIQTVTTSTNLLSIVERSNNGQLQRIANLNPNVKASHTTESLVEFYTTNYFDANILFNEKNTVQQSATNKIHFLTEDNPLIELIVS